ncbi:MAG: hypothetical protein JXA96_09615 [Sedimentisphaerales bacterium]|nr:hypothetical protein [Sedimentisphaerales bacterium]
MFRILLIIACLLIISGCKGTSRTNEVTVKFLDVYVTQQSENEEIDKDWLDNTLTYISENHLSEQEALKLWREILDSNPPKSKEIIVRLMMSAPITAPYNPYLSTDSFRAGAASLLEQLQQDFEDCQNHEAMMLAKIQLGKLYCSGQFGSEEFEKATTLWWEVLNVPEEEIVFDNPRHEYLNLDAIAKAKGRITIRGLPEDEEKRQTLIEEAQHSVDLEYREKLLRDRQSNINSLRRAAIEQLTYDLVEPEIRRRTRQRLAYLQQQRPDDSFYLETIDNLIAGL